MRHSRLMIVAGIAGALLLVPQVGRLTGQGAGEEGGCECDDKNVAPLAGLPRGADSGITANVGRPDADLSSQDAGQTGEGRTEDAGAPAEDAGTRAVTLISGLVACAEDIECGAGRCVRRVPMNRVDGAGVSGRLMVDLVPGLGETGFDGLCTQVCTYSDDLCDDFGPSTPDDANAASAWVCQIVALGASPYVGTEAGGSDLAEMTQGRPFGAVCRPRAPAGRLQLSPLCTACGPEQPCASGTCYNLNAGRATAPDGQGVCLPACGAQNCPIGFACVPVDTPQGAPLGSHCVPTTATCGSCVDRDGDGFGVGRCAGDEAMRGADCDDTNADAYFDPDNEHHPFPERCEHNDLNCDGLFDDEQQIGSAEFGAFHCTSCFDACGGDVPGGTAACQRDQGEPRCVVTCRPGFLDCNGAASDGCEMNTDAADLQLYIDADGDGRGEISSGHLQCPEAGAGTRGPSGR